jgi:hypothetical protein
MGRTESHYPAPFLRAVLVSAAGALRLRPW